ncbi:STAS domain-containing protein [Pseudoroseicyclus aestuarii]|uniref:RsbT antagonist protein RsbS n=1 Tax=Pseudoroseicyclus aestuarii TaxID=1795041 RepID=A0A318T0S5_9RHOB|nr:STAS domain-containing protein [Pseudoroseicyclus aestuarii]PYE85597.1 rsbT antagonist protein RsbS [Pseudoroseicyclus aestuarii]
MADTASVYLVEHVLLVAIPDNITDTEIMSLQEELSTRIVSDGARGVVIDIAALEIVDTFVGRVLAQLSSMARLLAAETFVVGMRPAVAMTLVELGMDLHGSRTALTLSHALRALRSEGLA